MFGLLGSLSFVFVLFRIVLRLGSCLNSCMNVVNLVFVVFLMVEEVLSLVWCSCVVIFYECGLG